MKTGGTPIITVENLVGGTVKLLPNTPHMSDEDKKRLHRYVLQEGDIVFSRVGSVDRSAYVTSNSDGWMFSGRLLRVHPSDQLDSKYLNYHFNDEQTKNLIRNLAVGGTMPSLNTEILNFVPIHYPEKPEQERIVGVLEVWDEYIEKLEQKIALKEQLKKGLMQQLLTGERRLPGFSGDWSKVQYADLCKFQSGYAFASSDFSESAGVRLIRNRDLKGGGGDLFYKGGRVPSSYLVNNGDVLVGMDGDFIAHRWSGGEALLNQRVGRLTNFNNSDSNFIYYRSQRDLKKIENETSSTTVKHLSAREFENRHLTVPDYTEQVAIGKVLSTNDNEIEQLKNKLRMIAKQKKYLLKNLITGTIRTPETLKPKGVSS